MNIITTKILREHAIKASLKAYSPYSKKLVGCALEWNNKIFCGCNIENASYGATVCAERIAIFNAISTNKNQIKSKISKLYVYSEDGWPPCGMCRQVIAEFANTQTLILIGNKNDTTEQITFNELMPLQFSSQHLLKK